ncbi:MAG: glycoside hydrolase family 5 protein [Planctomycetes bacterium]|nr:glycoside hydrolase family 5 protein [Planctomycetota bacterium]
MRHLSLPLLLLVLSASSSSPAVSGPIALHPENPHYFLWQGQPTILVTSGEHYGAVLNRAFDYRRYLATLQSHGFNLTRTFSGVYCEAPGAFKIARNTLAPAPGDLRCPWARSQTPGYANGDNKFDLTQWDPAYFQRLTDFVAEAGRRGIVVELVLFCPFYEDSMWELSPMNARNNVNGVGTMPRTEVYTLQHRDLLAVQDSMVRRIVAALKDCDHLYYEICNEPYFGGVTEEWQNHIAQTIVAAESDFPKKHLIAQNIANKARKIERPNPLVSIFNFHYAKPPIAVAQNYHLNKVIGDDETGFAGQERVRPYRIDAWDFIVAGGAVYSNLDYSFTVGHEQGDAAIDAPGGGGPQLRGQLEILMNFIRGFDFLGMKPDDTVVKSTPPQGTTVRVLCRTGQAYALYVNGTGLAELTLLLPAGTYQAEWVDTKTGQVAGAEAFRHPGGPRPFPVPAYVDDIALRICTTERERL